MKRVAKHLRPSGIAVITPWSSVEDFQEMIVADSADKPDLKIARMEQIRLKEPRIIEVTFHHLLGKNNNVHYHKQTIELGLFSRQEYISAITGADLNVVEEYKGSEIRGGAFICRKE